MFRLGTRAASIRMSCPPELMISSFSPLSVLMETGTSLMFSSRRSAVTVMVSSLPSTLPDVLVSASAACAKAEGMDSAAAIDNPKVKPCAIARGEQATARMLFFMVKLQVKNAWLEMRQKRQWVKLAKNAVDSKHNPILFAKVLRSRHITEL